jgi:antitoxin MazE
MSAKIQKWGNSLGIRIPKSIIEKANLNENSEVEIENKDGAIIIFPRQKKLSLDKLLSQISKDNLHKESDDEAEGNEVW